MKLKKNKIVSESLCSTKKAIRLVLIATGLVLASGAISYRLYWLQEFQHDYWLKLAAKQQDSRIEIQGVRGSVLDASGRTLAASVEAVSFGVHPKQLKNPEQAAEVLSRVLPVRKADLVKKFHSKRSFVWIARGLNPREAQAINELEIKGITPINEFRRYYPQGSIAGSILGRVSRDGAGQSGVEKQFESQLAAGTVHLPVQRDARGRLVSAARRFVDLPDSDAKLKKASLGDVFRNEGSDVSLTIDSVVQGILESEFRKTKNDAKAKRVYGMLMDAETGAVLGMAQYPKFNPNRFSNVSPDDLRNVNLQDSFEPGSTLKPLVAAAALNRGVARSGEVLDCENGRFRVGPHIVKDVHPIGMATFAEVLIRSSNVCMTKLGQRLGKESLHASLASYGFGKHSGIELPGEARGILRSPRNWKKIDVATHSFGQGVAVTAVQLVQAYSALANGGRSVRPTLLSERAAEPVYTQVIEKSAADRVANILRGVTEDEHGTGRQAKIAGVRVSGKTGTAQKALRNGRGYDPDHVIASFIGFVDGRDIGVQRKLVMFVAVDEPNVKPRWGGTLAAPAFRRSMEKVLSYLLTSGETVIRTAAVRRAQTGRS